MSMLAGEAVIYAEVSVRVMGSDRYGVKLSLWFEL